jgi:hypothetical protein
MKRRRIVGYAVVAVLWAAGGAMAQGGYEVRGSGGWGAGLPYGRLFDPATVQKLQGEVLWVKRLTPEEGMADGLHLLLKTREEVISVHLGPLWYLERQDFSLAAGDSIEVAGSRVAFEGQPAILAAELKKPDKVLLLREASGFPRWSAWQRR